MRRNRVRIWTAALSAAALLAVGVPAMTTEATYVILAPGGAVLVEGGLVAVAEIRAAGEAGRYLGLDTDGVLARLEADYAGLDVDFKPYIEDALAARRPTREFERFTVGDAAARGLLPDIAGMWLPDAVRFLEAEGYAVYITPEAGKESPAPVDIVLESGVITMPGRIRLSVDGVDYSEQEAGYQLLCVSGQNGEVLARGLVSPRLRDPEVPTTRVREFMTRCEPGGVIVGAVLWSNFLLLDDLAALQALGSGFQAGDMHEFMYRAHVFAADLAAGMAVEAFDPHTPVRAALFAPDRFADHERLPDLARGWAGPVVWLSGTNMEAEVMLKPWVRP